MALVWSAWLICSHAHNCMRMPAVVDFAELVEQWRTSENTVEPLVSPEVMMS